MPEQKSARGQSVTRSDFTAPPQTTIYPFGLGGLNLKDQLDQIPVGEFAIHTNLTHTKDRGAEVRPGMTRLASGGTNSHSVRRLSDPQNATYTRLWGIDQSLYVGQSGAVTVVDAGYSGDPLTLLPHRPPLSGDPWMFVADRSRMRKVRVDGLDLPIGLPAPTAAPTAALGTRHLTTIADFTGATAAVNWTNNAGYTYDDPPVATDLPEHFAGGGSPDSDNPASLQFGRIASTPLPTGSYVFWGCPTTVDLSLVGGVPASDDDYIHLWLYFSHPQFVAEVSLYLVCAASFSPSVLPGNSGASGSNIDAYVKSISGNDFTKFLQVQETQTDAAETARVRSIRDSTLQDKAIYRDRESTELVSAQQDPSRTITEQGPAGAEQWQEYGVLGVPLRRGDFKRIGSTAGRDWSTITGIIVVLRSTPGSGSGPIAMQMGNLYLHGGSAPDTGEPGLQSYDYRSTDYDPRTGAESNPGPVMVETTWIDPLRRSVIVSPPASGTAALRQRIYRRGGSNIADWNYLGVNAADGGTFTDTLSDADAGAADTLATDHYQPVPTIDDAGATVLAQPLASLFGPAQGLLFGCGDPYRPGHLYYCLPDQPDHWSASGNVEVCAPSEELMAGGMAGSQPFVFSRERLYSIYPALNADGSVTVTTTACRRGIVSRWAFTVGLGGIYGVSKDGVFRTGGGSEELVSEDIQPLFRGQTWNGYLPIDFTVPNAIRLSIAQDVLYLLYQDTGGNRQVLVYSILFQFWTAYAFGVQLSYLGMDDDTAIATTILGGKTTGRFYTFEGYSDDGAAISFVLRTADWDLGTPRQDKLLFDQILDADLQGATVTLQNRLNSSSTVNVAQALDVSTGRQRYTLDSFGTEPQRARTINTEIAGASSTVRPIFYFLGLSALEEPDQTLNRMTQWDDLGHPDEKWITGVTFDCDTGGTDRTILIEIDQAGTISTLATLTVNADGRHKLAFSWVGANAHKIRIRPDDTCEPWILYRADWIALPEPPRIAKWDSFFESAGDQYYTGLDLFCDTGNLEKQIQVTVDGSVLTNPYTGEAFWRITANGRSYLHLTFLAGRGHVFRFRALDTNPGLLYSYKWYLAAEPSEQSNWNSGYSVEGTLADKWFKAFLFEVDTFGQSKSVTVDIDGTVVETLSVQTAGRKVVQLALTDQKLGRVLRVYPTDGNPSRPYSIVPIFDVEPYQLTRWETQETDHGVPGFSSVVDLLITLKSTADVALSITTHLNQIGDTISDSYLIPSTAGAKIKRYVSCLARKGVLHKYVFTSSAAFHLYQEESSVQVQPWNGGNLTRLQIFGNDDQDRTRNMVTATAAAARSGGGS